MTDTGRRSDPFASIPRATGLDELSRHPLAFLERARREQGDVVVVVEDQALFSRSTECAGVVAVFGPENVRGVLSDMDTFGMPISASEQHAFPPKIANLNSGLFSMTGARHRQRQRMLAETLNASSAERNARDIEEGCADFLADWAPGATLPLLAEMRRFARHVCARLVFGGDPAEHLAIGGAIQQYFDLRREYAGLRDRATPGARDALLGAGADLDAMLRQRLVAHRGATGATGAKGAGHSVVDALARLDGDDTLSDDELVAHGNVVFMSSSEPVAVAMTWTLLLLTQLPALRAELRRELAASGGFASDGALRPRELDALPLLDGVLRETLRLVPPNAIMLRLSRARGAVGGHALPEKTEIVLSPYVAHRDPSRFPDPGVFRPARWRTCAPSPFEFFPFGGGYRYCLGKHFATAVIKAGIATILQRHDVVLAGDQSLDWRMHVTLMPQSDPMVQLLPPADEPRKRSRKARKPEDGGRLGGPVSDLFRFDGRSGA